MIELLVTVVIIMILATMYWGSTSPSRKRQLRLACQKNLQTIYIPLQIYANEHAGGFPALLSAKTSNQPLDLLVPKYTSDTSVFACPVSKDSPPPAGEPLVNHKISYSYYMGRKSTDANEALMSDRQIDTQPKTAGQVVFSTNGKSPGNNHKERGGNFLFTDGHAETSPPQLAFSIVVPEGVVLLNPRR